MDPNVADNVRRVLADAARSGVLWLSFYRIWGAVLHDESETREALASLVQRGVVACDANNHYTLT